MAGQNLAKWMVIYTAIGVVLGAGVGIVYSLCDSGGIDGKLIGVAVAAGVVHAITLPLFVHWRHKA